MKRKISFGLLGILFVLFIWQFELIQYGIRQAYGQLSIIYKARPVVDYLNDPLVSDSIKMKLNFINEVRTYAVTNLNLVDTDNYTEMYDQQGQPVLWVVTGCEPYSFDPYMWSFPVLGSVPYKGFFKKEYADVEFNKIKAMGLDVGMRTVGGWSTLGWFKDPILSEMLDRDFGDLANLIIHELVHSTIFVKDSVEFNENLASFIAEKGTLQYLNQKSDSTEAFNYKLELKDEKKFVNHMLWGYALLDSLYNDLEGMDLDLKKSKKQITIRRIMDELDSIEFDNINYINNVRNFTPNNTYFMSFKRYQSKQGMLDSIYTNEFNSDLISFIQYLKDKHPSL